MTGEPSAREEILARVRSALAGGSVPAPVTHGHRRVGAHPVGSEPVVRLLIDRLEDYRARVRRVGPGDDLRTAILAELSSCSSVVLPAGLPGVVLQAVTTSGVRVVADVGGPGDRPLSPAELDAVDAVLTTAAVAVAATGTIVLDGGPGQGRRALTLVPDRHLVVLTSDQVVETVPEAVARLEPARPTTLISGPSATSDIELERVEGVHGPRDLRVIILDGPWTGSVPVAAHPGG